ncbi:MAG TPA: hypothetical protein VFU27_06845, partial [Terriglobales bacterium]|nr:hypothetical protein [Terriglobales bacterium]
RRLKAFAGCVAILVMQGSALRSAVLIACGRRRLLCSFGCRYFPGLAAKMEIQNFYGRDKEKNGGDFGAANSHVHPSLKP